MALAPAVDLSFAGGKVVLITGGTNGLGAAMVDEFCCLVGDKKPAKVILVARSSGKAKQTAEQLAKAGIATSTYLAQLDKPQEVLAAARSICASEDELHLAILNAGVWLQNKVRTVQEDGLEVHFATNFLQMALLVQELTPLLAKSAPARFAVTGSFTSFQMAKGVLAFDHFRDQGPNNLSGASGYCYAQSKLAQHVWCKAAAPGLPEGVTINVSCPGAAPTDIPAWAAIKKSLGCCFPCIKALMGARDVPIGAKPLLHCAGAAAMDGITGHFVDWGIFGPPKQNAPAPLEFYPGQKMKQAPTTADPKQCKRLFDETAALCEELRNKYPASTDGQAVAE